jgi:hypothetical protein
MKRIRSRSAPPAANLPLLETELIQLEELEECGTCSWLTLWRLGETAACSATVERLDVLREEQFLRGYFSVSERIVLKQLLVTFLAPLFSAIIAAGAQHPGPKVSKGMHRSLPSFAPKKKTNTKVSKGILISSPSSTEDCGWLCRFGSLLGQIQLINGGVWYLNY